MATRVIHFARPVRQEEPPAPPLEFMRVMSSRVCVCGHQWIQPSPYDASPKCGSSHTKTTKQRVCKVARV